MKDTKSQLKWNNIYQDSEAGSGEPVWVLKEFSHLLPQQGKGLDLACGLAANGIFLAQQGLDVAAWDISDVVVAKLNQYAQANEIALEAEVRDLSDPNLQAETFDVIVVAHYLERSLAEKIVAALKPQGLLFYQTFVKEVTPSYSGPGNPDFRLDRNELLNLFADMNVVAYREEGLIGDLEKGIRNVAALVAQK